MTLDVLFLVIAFGILGGLSLVANMKMSGGIFKVLTFVLLILSLAAIAALLVSAAMVLIL